MFGNMVIEKVENTVRDMMEELNDWSVDYLFKNNTIEARIISQEKSIVLTFNKRGTLIGEKRCTSQSV